MNYSTHLNTLSIYAMTSDGPDAYQGDDGRFRPEDVGFFDPFLDEKEYGKADIADKGQKIYYRSVSLFIDAFPGVPMLYLPAGL